MYSLILSIETIETIELSFWIHFIDAIVINSSTKIVFAYENITSIAVKSSTLFSLVIIQMWCDFFENSSSFKRCYLFYLLTFTTVIKTLSFSVIKHRLERSVSKSVESDTTLQKDIIKMSQNNRELCWHCFYLQKIMFLMKSYWIWLELILKINRILTAIKEIVLKQEFILIVDCQVFHQMTQHQNFSISHYVFDCVDSCKSFSFVQTIIVSFSFA